MSNRDHSRYAYEPYMTRIFPTYGQTLIKYDQTTITILLPLTLAILPVLMLKLEEQIYSLPLSCVREIIPIEEDKVQYVGGKPTMVVRGEVTGFV